MLASNWAVLISLFTTVSLIPTSAVPYNGTACTVGTCKIDEQSLRFFVLGDWGGQDEAPFTTVTQRRVATAMNTMGEEKAVHFVMSVGDHFYTGGPRFANDSRFRTTFDDVFLFGKSKHLPWYLTAGNHDYYGDVRAQLEYAHMNPRWIYPNLSYVVHYELVPTSTTVDFVLFDTVVLCGETWGGGVNPETGEYEQPYELPKGPKDPKKSEALWSWIQRQLEESRADYLIAVGHYPIFTGGRHGDFVCPGVRLLTILEQHNVTAYLMGHDHNLQYLKSVSRHGQVVHHVLSGGGNSLDKATRKLDTQGVNITAPFFYPSPKEHIYPNTDNVGGFVLAEIGHQNGSFVWYNGEGKKLYQVAIHPRSMVSDWHIDPVHYHDAGVPYSTSKALLFSAGLFTIWLIGIILVRRSLSQRAKEPRASSRILDV